MQIQTNTDNTVEIHAPLTQHVETVVKDALSLFSDHITRVEVHLSEPHDSKSSSGAHHCMMEARMARHAPIVASANAATLHQAIHSAAEKLKRAIDSTLGRITDSAKGKSPVDLAMPVEEDQA